jgi:hypothetical protein
MTENIENLILEHLRLNRGDLANMKADMNEIKMRLTSVEERLTLVEKGVANIHGDLALLQMRLDRQGAENRENRGQTTICAQTSCGQGA